MSLLFPLNDMPQIPKFLMERWSAIDAEGIHLATIRVYHGSKSSSGKGPRIVLTLPPNPDNPSEEGDQYEMDMVNDTVQNQVVVAEREKEPGTGSRARTTILTGQVKHECSLRPMFTESYRQRLKARAREAATPKRMTMRMEEADLSGQGRINMLTKGVLHTTPFNVSVSPPRILAFFTYNCAQSCDFSSSIETQAETLQGPIRTHGAYSAGQASRRAFCCVCAKGALVYQSAARAYTATRDLSQGDPR